MKPARRIFVAGLWAVLQLNELSCAPHRIAQDKSQSRLSLGTLGKANGQGRLETAPLVRGREHRQYNPFFGPRKSSAGQGNNVFKARNTQLRVGTFGKENSQANFETATVARNRERQAHNLFIGPQHNSSLQGNNEFKGRNLKFEPRPLSQLSSKQVVQGHDELQRPPFFQHPTVLFQSRLNSKSKPLNPKPGLQKSNENKPALPSLSSLPTKPVLLGNNTLKESLAVSKDTLIEVDPIDKLCDPDSQWNTPTGFTYQDSELVDPSRVDPIRVDDSTLAIATACPRTKRCANSSRQTEPTGPTRCGGGYCCCCRNRTFANCSRTGDALRPLPSLPPQTRVLVFSGQSLKTINTSDFFDNVTQLTHLDLSFNALTYLHPDAFKKLSNLSVLWLNGNYVLDLTVNRKAIFSIGTLTWLDLSNTYAGQLAAVIFDDLPMLQLQRLFMNQMTLRSWNATPFEKLSNLTHLTLMQNDMGSISTDYISELPSLVFLNLYQNDLHDFPTSCKNGEAIYPRLETLILRNNRISQLSEQVCFPKLRVLDLSSNPIKHLVTNMFSWQTFPNLQCLKARHLQVWKMEAYAFNSPSLRSLDFMYNLVDFVNENIHQDSFKGSPNVLLLQLEHNYLSNARFVQLFGLMTSLQYVYIGNTDLGDVTADMFAPFPELRNITLHRNVLMTLNDGVFDGLQNLQRLDISNNRLESIGPDTFSDDTRRRLDHLDLSGNIFQCDCDLLWFRGWLRSGDPVISRQYTKVACKNLLGTLVVNYTMNQQVCLMSRDASVFTVVVVTLLMVTLTTVAALFKYRWHIRLMLYEAFRGKGQNCSRPSSSFRYDVFVSYAEEDVSWVRTHLIPQLEDRLGLRLCIHQRDFTPGQNIVDNIYTSVMCSRMVLMVFSAPFAASHWCQFELALCLGHVIETGDALLIACVDDVTSGSDVTPAMMAVLRTMTYIQWGEDPDAAESFWGRLAIALNVHRPAANEREIGD